MEEKEENIKMDLRGVGCEDGWWIELAQVCIHKASDKSSIAP
jgi:hypothetical protein